MESDYRDLTAKLREAASILDVIGEEVELKPAGSGRYKGICPFHREKTPSFIVSMDEQGGHYHCFGCEKHGDVIGFVMDSRGIEFKPALEFLGNRYGVLVEFGRKSEEEKKKDEFFAATEAAAIFYQRMLNDPLNGGKGRAYLKGRGISQDSQSIHKLGYAPQGWQNLYEELKRKKISDKVMTELGLVKLGDRGGYYDFFRNRLMIPIFDTYGKIIGFGARDLSGDDNAAKYLNSPQSPIFAKGHVFYGVDKALRAIRKTGKVYVEEGYFDLIKTRESGIENVIATMGTALTDQHRDFIKKMFPLVEIVHVLDSDKAGINAALKNGKKFIGMNQSVALLSEGKDPADIVESGERLEPYLGNAQPFFEFYINEQVRRAGGISLESRVKVLDIVKEDLYPEVPGNERGLFLHDLSKALDYPRADVNHFFGYKNGNEERVIPYGELSFKYWENLFLRSLIESPPSLRKHFSEAIEPNTFSIPEKYLLFDYLVKSSDDVSLATTGLFAKGYETELVARVLAHHSDGHKLKSTRFLRKVISEVIQMRDVFPSQRFKGPEGKLVAVYAHLFGRDLEALVLNRLEERGDNPEDIITEIKQIRGQLKT